MWDIIMVLASIWIGARLGRWWVLEQVKQLLSKIAAQHNTTVENMLSSAVNAQSLQSRAAELKFRIEQVNEQYYAWGPEGFAGQSSDPEELIKLLSQQYPNQIISLNPAELNLTKDKLTKHDTD